MLSRGSGLSDLRGTLTWSSQNFSMGVLCCSSLLSQGGCEPPGPSVQPLGASSIDPTESSKIQPSSTTVTTCKSLIGTHCPTTLPPLHLPASLLEDDRVLASRLVCRRPGVEGREQGLPIVSHWSGGLVEAAENCV